MELENINMPNIQGQSVFVQQSTLEKLKCFSCQKYLSILPIHVTPAGNPICGRCSLGDANSQRNVIYETAIEFQKFPCAYCDSGCTEVNVPAKLAIHEEICSYKKHKCLTRVYNNCIWEGTLTDMLDHFDKEHPAFLLKQHTFEVDCVNNHKERYLMPYEDDLYLVIREGNSEAGTFAITVSPLDRTHEAGHGIYELTLESGSRTYKCSMQETLGKRLELIGSSINQMLNEPLTIVARIAINKEVLPNFEKAEELDNRNDINYEELKIVECPVCLHYMISPIYQCATGHNICEECMATQECCPSCRCAFNRTRNFGLETLMMNRVYPCRHQGCKFSSLGANIKKHEAACRYGPIDCVLKDYLKCEHTFPGFKLFDHIKQVHYEHLLEFDTISVPFQGDVTQQDIVETYITKRYQMLFKICFKYNIQNEQFLWEVQMVGPDEERMKYYFELEVVDDTGNDFKLYVNGKCAPLVGMGETFANEVNYIMFCRNQLARFIKAKLTYRILIKEKI